jgi:L-fucose mutarotase
MLRGIPPILSPQLFKILMEMGHGDEIVLADGNFPAASTARRLVRADGHGVAPLLEAVLRFFPLDEHVAHPAILMAAEQEKPEIWNEYEQLLASVDAREGITECIERHAFYARAEEAYAVVATGETAVYANIILKKGVV